MKYECRCFKPMRFTNTSLTEYLAMYLRKYELKLEGKTEDEIEEMYVPTRVGKRTDND